MAKLLVMTNMTKANEVQALLGAIHEDYGDKLVFAEPVPVLRRLLGAAMLAPRSRDAIAAALSALANHDDGGVLLLGVRTGVRTEVLGIDDVETVNAEFQAILDGMVPPLASECRAYPVGERVVVAVEIEPVAAKAGCYDGRRGLDGGRFRVEGRRIVPWRVPERVERAVEAMPPPLAGPPDLDEDAGDRAPVGGASLRDVDGAALRRVLATAHVRAFEGESGDSSDGRLRALGIVAGRGPWMRPTRAAVLAFAHRPDRWMRGACVVVIDGAGAIVRTLVGEVPGLVTAASERVHVQVGVPKAAVEELLLNAWAHRDWEGEAAAVPIQLVVRRDRVEVISPGGRLDEGGVRNPTLRDLLRRRGVLGARGLGLGRVGAMLRGLGAFEAFEAGDEFHAVIEVAPIGVRKAGPAQRPGPTNPTQVVLPSSPVPVRVPMSPTTSAPAPATTSAAVGDAAMPSSVIPEPPATPDDELVAVLRARGDSTTRDLVEHLGWSRSKARDVLARLVDAGRVLPSATDPRSPHQSYRMAYRSGLLGRGRGPTCQAPAHPRVPAGAALALFTG